MAGALRFDPILRISRGWLHQQNVEQALRGGWGKSWGSCGNCPVIYTK